jgi:hypothetical protein
VKRMMAIAVALLVMSNVVLVGLLLWGQTTPSILPQLQAQTVARGGKYLIAASLTSSSNMCVYVIDETTDRMLVYVYDETRTMLRKLGAADLRADFQALGPTAPAGR